MLKYARVIVMREQDVAAREADLHRRKQELAEKERELRARKDELQQLQLKFDAVAQTGTIETKPADSERVEAMAFTLPGLATTRPTVAQRVQAFLEMEPRAFTPTELWNALELPPPIETLRTTLSKMAAAHLVARPFAGTYCALQHEAAILRRVNTG